MFLYIIKGRVLPIRASLSFGPVKFHFVNKDEESLASGGTESLANIEISIFSNEITVYYDIEFPKDIYDIKNECLNTCNAVVAQIGFLLGYGYSVEINQILCRELNINFVFGIDIPCLAVRNQGRDISLMMKKIFSIEGSETRYLQRCFVDLQLAITHPIDTPFYCYRAIESLRHFCRIRYNLQTEKEQWLKLSELTNKSWNDTKNLKLFANDARHGDHKSFSSQERIDFFDTTWDLVDGFIDSASKIH